MKGLKLITLYLCCTIQQFSCIGHEIDQKGDIMLGGIFPIREKGNDGDCKGQVDPDGALVAEAMLFAIDQINKNNTLLVQNGTKKMLGAYIRDSCSSPQQGIKKAVEFTSVYNGQNSDVKGLIVIDNPNVVIPVTNFLLKFDVVQIASRAMPKNSTEYSTLVDIEISDKPLIMALQEAVKAFEIRKIYVIISQTQFEKNGPLKFDAGNIEVVGNATIPLNSNQQDFNNIMKTILTEVQSSRDSNDAHVLLLTESEYEVQGILNAASNLSHRKLLNGAKFVWLATDGWGSHKNVVKGNEGIALGAITVEYSCSMSESFSEHLENVRKGDELWNYWHREYLKDLSRYS